jgi:uncharacterized Zn-finger protein
MRTHSNDKPFVCKLCGNSYTLKNNLRRHVRTNHKEDFQAYYHEG